VLQASLNCNIFCHYSKPHLDNCCSPLWTRHRELWAKVVSHPVFDGFIMFLIAASSITLCFEVNNELCQSQTVCMARSNADWVNYCNGMYDWSFPIGSLSARESGSTGDPKLPQHCVCHPLLHRDDPQVAGSRVQEILHQFLDPSRLHHCQCKFHLELSDVWW